MPRQGEPTSFGSASPSLGTPECLAFQPAPVARGFREVNFTGRCGAMRPARPERRGESTNQHARADRHNLPFRVATEAAGRRKAVCVEILWSHVSGQEGRQTEWHGEWREPVQNKDGGCFGWDAFHIINPQMRGIALPFLPK